MDDKLKRRLIGAAVLASLAVIFVPMLVEEEPVPGEGISGSNIPPREDLTFRSQVLKDEITVPTDAPAPVVAPEPAEPTPAAPVAVAPAPDVTPTAVEPPPEVVSPPVAEPVAKTPAEKPAPSAPPAPPPLPVTPAKAPPPVEVAKAVPPAPASAGPRITAWIVQVGNFSTRAKADAVANQLRGKGLEVFVEPIGKPAAVYRVAVGPESDRKRAEALVSRVEAAFPSNDKPFIRSYP